MIPLEYEISRITNLYFEMHDLVQDQISRTRKALIDRNTDAAREVMQKETRVNFYETTIDEECEDLLALHRPVASDLRLAIALIKMSGNLERIGDHAYGICGYLYDDGMVLNGDLIKAIKLPELFEEIDAMFENIRKALKKKDVMTARQVFKQDKRINKANRKIPIRLEKYAKKNNNEKISDLILIARTVGRLERTGDQLKNIAEEIIFYIKSNVARHKKKNKKIRKKFANQEPTDQDD